MEEVGIDPSRYNLRNKGLTNTAGRLFKGCVKDAYTKLSIGSIPSNYEAIIYQHNQKKGFGSSQTRFNRPDNKGKQSLMETQVSNEQQTKENIHPSHSKKGYGPFINRQQRQCLVKQGSPKEGTWLVNPHQQIAQQPPNEENCSSRKCYSREYYRRPRKQVERERNSEVPGPGFYDPEQVADRANGWRSAFTAPSHAKHNQRNGYIPKSLTPGPGWYSPKKQESQQPKQTKQQMEQEYFKKINDVKRVKSSKYLPQKRRKDTPGPGAYDWQKPTFKPLYEQIKISGNFVSSGKERLDYAYQKKGSKKAPPPVGAYEIPSAFDKEKRLIEMSAFMSECKREPFEGRGLGPNVRMKSSEGKKNFHFNIRDEWM